MSTFNLEDWRKSHSMTQAQLAERLWVSTRTVVNWEQGVPIPGRVIELACKALEHE